MGYPAGPCQKLRFCHNEPDSTARWKSRLKGAQPVQDPEHIPPRTRFAAFPTCLPHHRENKLMANPLIKHVSDSSFEADVLKSEKPVLVDFWAEWCGPCKSIAPTLDELATDYGERLQIAKVNVDENQTVPAKFGIRSIPTLLIFKKGELADSRIGALTKAQLSKFIDQQLA
jgi:thioredoxin 1